MAQAQLDDKHLEIYRCVDGFEAVVWLPKSNIVNCIIDSEHTMTVKRKGRKTYVFIKKGTAIVRVRMEIFEHICDLKESIALICSFLEGQENTKDV